MLYPRDIVGLGGISEPQAGSAGDSGLPRETDVPCP
jgi:hypothetical protein